jgi:hypothetical protein
MKQRSPFGFDGNHALVLMATMHWFFRQCMDLFTETVLDVQLGTAARQPGCPGQSQHNQVPSFGQLLTTWFASRGEVCT